MQQAYATKMYAMTSKQGTACAETALCSVHYNVFDRREEAENRGAAYPIPQDRSVPDSWTDCSGNEELACSECGAVSA